MGWLGMGRSRRSLRHNVRCGREELCTYRALLLAIRGSQKVWDTRAEDVLSRCYMTGKHDKKRL